MKSISVTRIQGIMFILLIGFLCISFIRLSVFFLFIPLLCVFVFSPKVTIKERRYTLLFGGILICLVNFGIVRFPMFPQAEYLFSINEDVFYWFAQRHVHAVRLLIVYPGVIVGKMYGLTTDQGVTLYSASLMLLIMYMMLRILEMNECENHISAIVSGLLILALSIAMNGRLIFVFFGITLLALYELKYSDGMVSMLILQVMTGVSVFFTLVSSGTMMIALAYAIFIIPYRWIKSGSYKDRCIFLSILFLCIIPILTIVMPYVIVMLLRNIHYYGGGIQGVINLLNHGLGRFIDTSNTMLIVSLVLIGCLIVLINIVCVYRLVYLNDDPSFPLILFVNLSIYGSVFGISTGLTGLIPFFVLIIRKISSFFRFGGESEYVCGRGCCEI